MVMFLKLSDSGRNNLIVLTLPPNYSYCILVALGSMGVIAWKSVKVQRARQFYEIFPPKMYSETNHHFNCIQRAHQNTLENYPQFLSLLLLGGLDSPLWCATGGVIYLLGRVAYAQGYYSGDPKNRNRGLFGYAGLLMMFGATVKLAVRLIQFNFFQNSFPIFLAQ